MTIIAIPAGLYGYFLSQHTKRVETAFEFYKSFKADRIQENWSLLMQRWNAKADEFDRLLTENNQDGFRQLALSLVSDNKGAIAVEQIASFFDEVSECVNSGLCDNNTAFAMLKEPASQFWGAYGVYILHIREKYKNDEYGIGVSRTRSLALKPNYFYWY